MGLHALTIAPLVYQSQNITLPEWGSLLTLCLAPLIAHIVAGAPEPTYLSRSRPRWHDRLCHFNPVSIVWRYGVIADRRIRARRWSPLDTAAANAIFWTRTGWDGSEEMAHQSVLCCVHLPALSHVAPLSWATTKTVIVSIQGFQAIYTLAAALAGTSHTPISFAVDKIFFPLPVFGLLRLCAAFWLTDDFVYNLRDDIQMVFLSEAPTELSEVDLPSRDMAKLLDPSSVLTTESRFRPTSFWASRIFRGLYVTPLVIIWAFGPLYLIPWPEHGRSFTVTSFMAGVIGAIFTTAALCIYVYYAFWLGSTSTIIPCIVSPWYKAFTIFYYMSMGAAVVVSAIETRRTSCGTYTTDTSQFDAAYCS